MKKRRERERERDKRRIRREREDHMRRRQVVSRGAEEGFYSERMEWW